MKKKLVVWSVIATVAAIAMFVIFERMMRIPTTPMHTTDENGQWYQIDR